MINVVHGIGVCAALLIAGSAYAQRDFSDVEIRVEHARGNIHVLFGAGGNIGVSVGDDGVFLVDDQFAPLTDKILAAIATLTDQKVAYVINTHHHGDHSGGNENLGKAGALILAHDNVHTRILSRVNDAQDDGDGAGESEDALPVISFSENLSLYVNGDEARALHVPRAHTDGDSLIYFKTADVLHMGDTYFAQRLPYIDTKSGGSLKGIIGAMETALSVAGENTAVIPGHGPLQSQADLVACRDMLVYVRDTLSALKADGLSLKDVVARRPLDGLDARWLASGPGWTDRFIGFVYSEL